MPYEELYHRCIILEYSKAEWYNVGTDSLHICFCIQQSLGNWIPLLTQSPIKCTTSKTISSVDFVPSLQKTFDDVIQVEDPI